MTYCVYRLRYLAALPGQIFQSPIHFHSLPSSCPPCLVLKMCQRSCWRVIPRTRLWMMMKSTMMMTTIAQLFRVMKTRSGCTSNSCTLLLGVYRLACCLYIVYSHTVHVFLLHTSFQLIKHYFSIARFWLLIGFLIFTCFVHHDYWVTFPKKVY